jgi:hypothetical protein
MKGQSFRLKMSILGFSIDGDGQRIPVNVPLHAIVTVQNDPTERDEFVRVVWEGKTISMFAQDLRARGVSI